LEYEEKLKNIPDIGGNIDYYREYAPAINPEFFGKEKILNHEPTIYFGSSLDCISAHSFLSFICTLKAKEEMSDHVKHYTRDYLNYEGVNWKKMVENSIREHKGSEPLGLPVTEYGEPLLKVCVQNEEE
jgi:hypothetical protein